MECATRDLMPKPTMSARADAIVTCNPAGDITFVNNEARLLANRLASGEVRQILPEDHQALVAACPKRRHINGSRLVGEYQITWSYEPVSHHGQISLRGCPSPIAGEAAILKEALDRLTVGIAITDMTLRLIASNQSARQLLGRASPGWDEGSKLFKPHPRLTSILLKRAQNGGGPLQLFVPPHQEPLEVMVFVTPAERPRFCLLYFVDPCRLPVEMPSVVAQIHGLTPAEVRVAKALLSTCNVGEVAATLRLSRNTVRTHLRNLWRKTGTRRATELVHRLMASVAFSVGSTNDPAAS